MREKDARGRRKRKLKSSCDRQKQTSQQHSKTNMKSKRRRSKCRKLRQKKLKLHRRKSNQLRSFQKIINVVVKREELMRAPKGRINEAREIVIVTSKAIEERRMDRVDSSTSLKQSQMRSKQKSSQMLKKKKSRKRKLSLQRLKSKKRLSLSKMTSKKMKSNLLLKVPKKKRRQETRKIRRMYLLMRRLSQLRKLRQKAPNLK